MTVWVFQGKPERYPLDKNLIAGNKETWLVSRYKEEISKGDIVLFWSSGKEGIRGFYGWGEVTQNKVEYYKDWGYGIEILYNTRFKNHIGVKEIRESQILKDNVLLKMPIGTNFKLTDQEYENLATYIKELGEIAPPLLDGGKKND